jgi:hypothetical protein
MVSVLFGNPFYVDAKKKEKNKLDLKQFEVGSQEYTYNNDITDLDGTLLGKKEAEVKKETKVTNKGVTITLNTEEIYTTPSGTMEVKENKDVIVITKDEEVTINGIALTQEELNQTKEIPQFQMAAISGGKSYLTYYKEQSSNYWYMKAYKKPTNAFLNGGSGTPRTRYSSGNSKVTDFKSLARSVGNARDNINEASAVIAGAAGVMVFTFWNVLTWLGWGGTVGLNAWKIYNNSESGKNDMLDAYNVLGRI